MVIPRGIRSKDENTNDHIYNVVLDVDQNPPTVFTAYQIAFTDTAENMWAKLAKNKYLVNRQPVLQDNLKLSFNHASYLWRYTPWHYHENRPHW